MKRSISLVRLLVLIVIVLEFAVWYRHDTLPLLWHSLEADVVVGPPTAANWSGGRITFRAKQWHSVIVPRGEEGIHIHVEQVTVHDVKLAITQDDGTFLVSTTSVLEGDKIRFAMNGREYTLSVVDLVNSLSGDDYAVLQITQSNHDLISHFELDQEIERLLLSVEVSQFTFVLEGAGCTGAEAAAQLRRKWRATGTQYRTINDFIEYVASRSSIDAEPYEVELPDGSIVDLRDWLREQLKQIRRASRQ